MLNKIRISLCGTSPEKDMDRLLHLVDAWVFKGSPAVYEKLGPEIQELARALIPTAVKGVPHQLYRALAMKTDKVIKALRTGKINLVHRAYTSWSAEAPSTGRYVQGTDYGIVVTAHVPKSAVVLDLYELVHTLSKLNNAHKISGKSRLMLQSMRNDLDEEHELIVFNAPSQCEVHGIIIVAPNEVHLTLIEEQDIEYKNSDDAETIFIERSDILSHLDELH